MQLDEGTLQEVGVSQSIDVYQRANMSQNTIRHPKYESWSDGASGDLMQLHEGTLHEVGVSQSIDVYQSADMSQNTSHHPNHESRSNAASGVLVCLFSIYFFPLIL
eukprot:GHVR01054107.1.p1 GENE.GHVR01054107.1~~GHVR01054107.1.p1  ORF type:complete len:106 (+),score=17.14 GHVR01054107.1:418-735(+)